MRPAELLQIRGSPAKPSAAMAGPHACSVRAAMVVHPPDPYHVEGRISIQPEADNGRPVIRAPMFTTTIAHTNGHSRHRRAPRCQANTSQIGANRIAS